MWDIIILGGGPAGYTAGMYATRAGMKTLLIEKLIAGGQAATTEWVDNYPGFPDGISGPELSQKFEAHALRFGLQTVNEEATGMGLPDTPGRPFNVETDLGSHQGLAIIAALGADWNTLGIPGEDKLRGMGVSYCATCDGPFYQDQEVVVVGGGDTAVEESTYLTKIVKKVTIIHRRDRLRATQVIQNRALADPKIEFIWNTVVESIEGEMSVEKLGLRDLKTDRTWEIPCAGIFIFVGTVPNTQILQGMMDMDERGYIITDDDMRTSVDGIFACGDARKKLLRQIVTACGEGATAAFTAQHHVDHIKGTSYD
ncbi:thioredoxin-disulfide reductase [Thermodesulfobacteriota bacterium]